MINVLEGINETADICTGLVNILYLVGVVMFVLKIAIPIILIAVGSFDLVKAVTAQKDDDVKKAATSLAKKAVAAVAVFLIPTIVGLLFGLVGGNAYQDCYSCINDPFNATTCPKKF